jgi:hypothetical protein
VCVATACSIEWEKENIMAFELLHEQEEEDDDSATMMTWLQNLQTFMSYCT